MSTDASKKGEKTIQDERAAFNFRTVGDRAKVIQDGGTPVLVPYGLPRKQSNGFEELVSSIIERFGNSSAIRSTSASMTLPTSDSMIR